MIFTAPLIPHPAYSRKPVITEENPYAPPQSTTAGVPDAPKPFGWEVAGKVVIVKPSAQFPMIDPFTGGTAETMMLHKIEVRYRPGWLLAIPALGALSMLTMEKGRSGGDLIGLALIGFFLGWLVSLFVGLAFPVCTLRLFFEKRTLTIRKYAARVMNGLFLLGFPGGLIFSMAPPWTRWIPTVAFLCWLIGLLAGATVIPRLRCNRKTEGRFDIRGFHPRALEALVESGKPIQQAQATSHRTNH